MKFSTVVTCFFLLIALMFFGDSYLDYRRHYTPVKAVIIEQFWTDDNKLGIAYEYNVNGKTYKGLSNNSLLGTSADAMQRLYTSGKKTTVYYDNDKPEISEFEAGYWPEAIFAIFILTGAILFRFRKYWYWDRR